MTDYSATVTADLSGYNTSVQQAIALTNQYAAANEGLMGTVGRMGTRGIGKLNESLGITNKLLKANVSEAANYQQMLGRVSAASKAAGQSPNTTRSLTLSIGRNVTGSTQAAEALVTDIVNSGETRTKQMRKTAEVITNLSAATGESGSVLAGTIRSMQRTYGQLPEPRRMEALGDSIVSTTKKFGASTTAATQFANQISPFAKQVGLAQTSVVGFSTAFARMGEDGYRSANVFSKVLSDIDSAVRDGQPTLGTYAAAMGTTYKQAEDLAKNNPAEFLIQFTEAMEKQGSKAIRTYESLGLEGVRTQKVMSALTSSGDLREMVTNAQATYGSGTTAQAAEEQLKGLNEQASKFQESLKQVGANSGAPMLGFLEKALGLTTKLASGLAGVTGSQAFQTAMVVPAVTAAGAGVGMKLLSGALTVGGIGEMTGMIGSQRLGRGMDFISRNRKTLAIGGGIGMAAGQITGQPGMSTLGMGALALSSLSPGMFTKARTAAEFIGRGPSTMMTIPFTEWGERKDRDWRLANRERGANALFRPTGSQDQFASLISHMKDSEDFSKEDISKAKKVFSKIGPDGKVAAAGGLASLLDRKAAGSLDVGSVQKAMEEAELLPEGGRRARLGAQMRNTRGMAGGLAKGMLWTQPLALAGAMGPVGWGAAAAGVAAGAGVYMNQRNDKRNENLQSGNVLREAEKVAASYGVVAPKFDALAASTDAVTNSFQSLTNALAPDVEKGKFNLSPGEYAQIKAPDKPSADLNFQNYRIGPQTTGSQRADASAISEIIGIYGSTKNKDNLGTAVTDLKAAGKSAAEINKIMVPVAGMLGDSGAMIGTALQSMADDTHKIPGMRNEVGVTALSRIIGDRQSTMTDEAQVAEIYDKIVEMSRTWTPAEQRRVFKDVVKVDGMKEMGLPLEAPPNPADVEEAKRTSYAGVGYEPPETSTKSLSEQVQAWRDEHVGATKTPLEQAFSGVFGAMSTPLIDRMRTSVTAAGDVTRYGDPMNPGANGGYIRNTDNLASGGARRLDVNASDAESTKLAKLMTDAVAKFQPGRPGVNLTTGRDIASGVLDLYGGNTDKAASQLRQLSYGTPPDTELGQLTTIGQQEVAFRQNVQQMGMTDWGKLMTGMGDAASKLKDAQAALKANPSETAENDVLAAQGEVQQNYTDQISYMQSYLKSVKALHKQMGDAEVDYQESVSYAQQDYNTSRRQSQEQFDKQMKYSAQDYHTSMYQMAQDYHTSMERSDRDYNKSRERAMVDHGVAMARHAEDAAKSMYDPFKRISLEQTWSGGGLATNLKQQSEAFAKQVKDLDKLRKSGVSQGVIDQLGLNDPGKAQQLSRLLRDIKAPGGKSIVGDLNRNVSSRVDSAEKLFGAKNDLGTRRSEEDYNKSLKRMAEDRQTWLEDAEADYKKARGRAATAFDRAMTRAQEGYDTSMRYMEDAQARALERMSAAHKKQISRTQRDFEDSFEVITSNYEDLIDATSTAMEKGPVKWNKIVREGMKDMKDTFADGAKGIDGVMTKSLDDRMRKQWGVDGTVTKSWTTLLNMLMDSGTGGGPTGAWADPGASRGEHAGGGSFYATGGKGVSNNRWHAAGNYSNPRGWHTGTDISGVPYGSPIYATRPGKVVQSGYNGAYGNSVTIDVDGENVELLNGHMSSISARRGQHVSRGTMIGRIGSTGNSTGNHLHFEARRPPYNYGSDISPYAYMWQGGITQGQPMDVRVGENVYPEAIIPLNQRGIDVLSQALERAFGAESLGATLRGGAQVMHVHNTTINKGQSTTVSGPITVVAGDPNQMARALERKARENAVITPGRR